MAPANNSNQPRRSSKQQSSVPRKPYAGTERVSQASLERPSTGERFFPRDVRQNDRGLDAAGQANRTAVMPRSETAGQAASHTYEYQQPDWRKVQAVAKGFGGSSTAEFQGNSALENWLSKSERSELWWGPK